MNTRNQSNGVTNNHKFTERLTSQAFQQMSQAAANLKNPSLTRWKQNGGKVMGFVCSMAPEELFMAAGMQGFRMRATGSTNTDLADNYFSNLNCTFPRNCLNMGMEGEFDFLDGVVHLNSCDHIRRLYDNWKVLVPTEFIEFISLPKQAGEDQVNWFVEEIHILKEKVETHFNVRITAEKLQEAIALTNETRGLQRKLYDLRKQDDPPITGAETLAVIVAGTAMPKKEYNKLWKQH
jgi:benzoyl-CoA reductase subunit C